MRFGGSRVKTDPQETSTTLRLRVHGVILIHIITSYPKNGESYTIMDIAS